MGWAKASLGSTGHAHFAQTRNKIQGKEASRKCDLSRHVTLFFWKNCFPAKFFTSLLIVSEENLSLRASFFSQSYADELKGMQSSFSPTYPISRDDILAFTDIWDQCIYFPNVQRVSIYKNFIKSALYLLGPLKHILSREWGIKKKQKRLYVHVSC